MKMQSNIRKQEFKSPHFLIIGAAKSGTTTLYDDLASHPEADMPANKEPDILHSAKTVEDALKLWDWHFEKTTPGVIRGEASTKYTMAPEFPEVASFAREALGPHTRIVYVMRHPVERIKSHIAHDCAVGRLDKVLPDVAALEISRYVSWSDYPRQIRPWVDAFGRQNIKAIVFEDLARNRTEMVREVAEFVGLDPKRLPERKSISNARGSQRLAKAAWLGQAINSSIYRHYVRSIIPTPLHRLGKRSLTQKTGSHEVELTPKTRLELERRLAHVAPELRAIGIEPGDW